MSDQPQEEPKTYPVPIRLQAKDGDPKPHIGPSIDDYKKAHAETVGEGSDAWWAEVSSHLIWNLRLRAISTNVLLDGE